MLKSGGDPLPGRLGAMIAADGRVDVPLGLVERREDALPMGGADARITAHEAVSDTLFGAENVASHALGVRSMTNNLAVAAVRGCSIVRIRGQGANDTNERAQWKGGNTAVFVTVGSVVVVDTMLAGSGRGVQLDQNGDGQAGHDDHEYACAP
jgi:hypothetical protein